MVLAEGKHGNAGGQGSVGVWNARAWPPWGTIVEGSCRAGSRLNSLRHCPDGLEFTPVGNEEDRVQESQFKAGGLAGMALQREQGHSEEGRGLGNLLKDVSKAQGQHPMSWGAFQRDSSTEGLGVALCTLNACGTSSGPSECGGHIQVGEWGWKLCIGRRWWVPVTWDWVTLPGEHGQRKGCGGAARLHTSEPKGNLSPETTFLSSPAIPLEVINPFQSMMVSFVKQEQWVELPRQLINFLFLNCPKRSQTFISHHQRLS